MKKLLFIEDQIPHFDQAAGARTSFIYLKLLVDLGVSVTFIGADFKETEPYADHLRALGVEVLAGKWFQVIWRLWFLFFVRQFDYVFFNRLFPTKRFIDYVAKFSKARTLYQCHDLHYLRLLRQYEIDGDEQTLALARRCEKLELEFIQRADVFLTFSQHEKDIVVEKFAGQRAEVVPLYFYEKLSPPITDFSRRHGVLFVGGFMHKPNVDAVLWFVKEVFPEIKKQCPEVIFYIAGSHAPREITELSNDEVKVLGYVTDAELASLYGQVRLVVIPLRFGAGVKGKTIEAIHHSLPLVSTSIGVEGIALEGIVLPTDKAKDFAARVVALYNDETDLRRCSVQLYDFSQRNLSTAAARERIEHILNSLQD